MMDLDLSQAVPSTVKAILIQIYLYDTSVAGQLLRLHRSKSTRLNSSHT